MASCPRQCGKTFTLARDLIGTCLESPGAEVLYIAATAAAARAIMWSANDDGVLAVLPAIGLVEGTDYEPHDSRMEVRFSNGSLLTLVGVDRADFNKLRGQKKDLIVVDEAQLQNQLGAAVRSVLNYMLLARQGRLVMAGTPNWSCSGYMFDAVHGLTPGWSVHRWTTRDIRSQPHLWLGALARKAELGLADDDPEWMREGLGLWVRDQLRTVLPVGLYGALWDGVLPSTIPSRDGATTVPRRLPMIRQIGLDPGDTSATAMVCVEYSLEEGVVREVETQSVYEADIDVYADMLRDMRARLGVTLPVVVDQGGLGGLLARQLVERHGIPCVPARKYDRDLQVSEIRAAARRRRLLVRRGSELHAELEALVYDARRWEHGVREVDPRCEDHRFDALRYVWWMARAHLAEAPPDPETSDERAAREAEEDAARRLTRPDRRGSRTPRARGGRR